MRRGRRALKADMFCFDVVIGGLEKGGCRVRGGWWGEVTVGRERKAGFRKELVVEIVVRWRVRRECE